MACLTHTALAPVCEPQNTVYSSIVPAMVAAAKSKSVTGFWRRQVRVLAAWRLLPFLCPRRSASEDVMAVLQMYLDIGSAPVRRATVCAMVWFMRFGATGVIRAKMKHSLLTTYVARRPGPALVMAAPPPRCCGGVASRT